MARVYDNERQTVTDTKTGATVYYGGKVTGLKHSRAFYEDMRARVGSGACTTCQRPCNEHSDEELDVCLDKLIAAPRPDAGTPERS